MNVKNDVIISFSENGTLGLWEGCQDRHNEFYCDISLPLLLYFDCSDYEIKIK